MASQLYYYCLCVAALAVGIFFLAILVNFLSNQIPEDFITMGKCKHFLAAFCKILPVLIVLLHWVLLIAIIVNWIMIITESCKYSQVNSGPSVSKEQYFIDSRTNLIVTSVIWFFLHYIGSILKDLSYVEPFMYTPKTQESNSFLHVSFRVLGP